MKNTIWILFLILLFSCGRTQKKTDSLEGEISISGAFALYPLVVKWAEEFQQLHPGVKIDISAGGAGKGMTDVLGGVVDLGMISREIYPTELKKGALVFAIAKDAVVPIINKENPILDSLMKYGLSKETADKLWGGRVKTWGELIGNSNSLSIHLYTRSDACGAGETWASYFQKRQEDLNGTAVFGDPGLATAVQKDYLGIGYCNIAYVYDEETHLPNENILVLPLDVNGDGILGETEFFYETKDALIQAIASNHYPSPPARELYIVSKNISAKVEVISFLEFILTKGQEFNIPTGYINIDKDKIESQLDLLRKIKLKQ